MVCSFQKCVGKCIPHCKSNVYAAVHIMAAISSLLDVCWLVGWSSTSLFSTNMLDVCQKQTNYLTLVTGLILLMLNKFLLLFA